VHAGCEVRRVRGAQGAEGFPSFFFSLSKVLGKYLQAETRAGGLVSTLKSSRHSEFCIRTFLVLFLISFLFLFLYSEFCLLNVLGH